MQAITQLELEEKILIEMGTDDHMKSLDLAEAEFLESYQSDK